jgi:hypothetical protein
MSRTYLDEVSKDTRFKPGVSGNPGGRPKLKTLSRAYKNLLEQPNPADKEGRSYAECLAEVMIKQGLKGSVPACIELANRVEGVVRQGVADVDDEFASMSVEELEQELERTRTERPTGVADKATPPDGGYPN